MQVTVKWFGPLREATGTKELGVRLPDGARLRDLAALLAREHAAFAAMADRLRAAVNQEVAEAEARLADGDEVAFLPPVAGGQGPPDRSQPPSAVPRSEAEPSEAGQGPPEPRCTLSDRPLDVGRVVARVRGPDAGGIVTFVGTVRDASRGHGIRHLEYEAYPQMAEREMERIADEAAAQWPGARVAMAHRTGHLAIGELAVVIAAAAPHRAEAFAAARFAIDTLKQRVPIWKKEVAVDGEYWVEEHA
jgi:molybdopterin synthase catalytic subunit